MLGTLICDDCAQILEAFNLIQFFTVDSDVHADTICVVGHQFGLLCTTVCQRLQRSSPGDPPGRLVPPGPARPSMLTTIVIHSWA